MLFAHSAIFVSGRLRVNRAWHSSKTWDRGSFDFVGNVEIYSPPFLLNKMHRAPKHYFAKKYVQYTEYLILTRTIEKG